MRVPTDLPAIEDEREGHVGSIDLGPFKASSVDDLIAAFYHPSRIAGRVEPDRQAVEAAFERVKMPFALDRPPKPQDGEDALLLCTRVFAWEDVTRRVAEVELRARRAREANQQLAAWQAELNDLTSTYQTAIERSIAAGEPMPTLDDEAIERSARLRIILNAARYGRSRSGTFDLYSPPDDQVRVTMHDAVAGDLWRCCHAVILGVCLQRVLSGSRSAEARRVYAMGQAMMRMGSDVAADYADQERSSAKRSRRPELLGGGGIAPVVSAACFAIESLVSLPVERDELAALA